MQKKIATEDWMARVRIVSVLTGFGALLALALAYLVDWSTAVEAGAVIPGKKGHVGMEAAHCNQPKETCGVWIYDSESEKLSFCRVRAGLPAKEITCIATKLN